MRRSPRLTLGLAATVVLLLSALPGINPAAANLAMSGPAFTATKTVTRDHLINGVTSTVDSRTVSLSVSETQNLRGFQPIDVSWTGAHPTGGSVSDVNDGFSAVGMEYPMVLLECRGVDSPAAPMNQQLDPTTCWTAYESSERGSFQQAGDTGFPPWRLDLYASPAQRIAQAGVPPDPNAALAGTTPPRTVGTALSSCQGRAPIEYWVPFVASGGGIYYPAPDCPPRPDGFPQPPEAQSPISSTPLTFPSNETYGITGPDGSGRAKFDVFTANENSSLGCSESVACSLVAVPVMGIGCDVAAAALPPQDQPPPSVAAQAEAACTASGHLGSTGNTGDLAVQGRLWWAASNWRNRITVPLTFVPVGDPCAVTGLGKAEVDIYGSESMTEATAQWNPHFCLDPTLFTLKHIQNPEPSARNILAQGNVVAAYSSYAPAGSYSSPVVKAPVALTGFAISFIVDDNAGHEVTSLKLNPRLLAKLLTESYPTAPGDVQTSDPGLQHNPLNVTQDPEFIALNPAISADTTSQVAFSRAHYELDTAGALYALSSDSDAMYALTSYLNNDPEANAWLNGAPDPWGMVVNPNYNLAKTTQIAMPTSSWRLLDTFKSNVGLRDNGCPDLSASPYLGLVASPVSQMLRIAQAVQFAWPLSTTDCVHFQDLNNNTVSQVKRQARSAQGGTPGTRFILGLTSLGEANRYGLHTASLQTQVAPGTPPGQFAPPDQRTFAAPNDASLRAAAALVAADPSTQTWQVSPDAIRASPFGTGAYPGAMVVSAQIPTSGLSGQDATNLAKFLRFAAGDGQQPGTSIGQLPPGYLPMTSANGMGALVAYTNAAADAVASQSGTVPEVAPGAVVPSAGSTSAAPASNPSSAAATSKPTTPSSTVSPGATGAASPSGGFAAIGPNLGGTSSGAQAKAAPPVGAPTGAAAVLGKTLAVLSEAGSYLQWLIYIAAAALAGAAGFYFVVGRRLGVKFTLSGFREFLRGLFARFARGRTPR